LKETKTTSADTRLYTRLVYHLKSREWLTKRDENY
jgi:hypothetical protein